MSNNIEKENRYAELVIFIRRQIGEYNLRIERNTLIEDDLGVTGEDATELIVAFSKKFGVTIDNFKFTKYFYDEPGIFNIQNRVIAPLSIGHLEKAIWASRLDEYVINN